MRQAAGWLAALLSGGVWGVAFFSWALPLSIPARIGTTVVVVVVLAAASRAGMLAAGSFALGMGASSSALLASSGLLFSESWGLMSGAALLAGVGFQAVALLQGSDGSEPSS